MCGAPYAAERGRVNGRPAWHGPCVTPEGMTTDRSSNRTDGETHGREQQPVEAGARDTTQRDQARGENAPGAHDPARPDAALEDSLERAPDGQAGTPSAGTPSGGGESIGPGAPFIPSDDHE